MRQHAAICTSDSFSRPLRTYGLVSINSLSDPQLRAKKPLHCFFANRYNVTSLNSNQHYLDRSLFQVG
jgi:hypothetical protein